MTDLKLFKLERNSVTELSESTVDVEKSLQTLLERHLEEILGVRFLATEYSTGQKHRGRIDTLGLDENNVPVIIEYKRALNQNVINQGLFYLDWLLDHKADFHLLVQKKLGHDVAESVSWNNPRLLCIAGDFTKYDEHAVQQMGRDIELLRYRRYGEDLLLLELVNAVEGGSTATAPSAEESTTYRTMAELLDEADGGLKDRYERLRAFATSLGDDVQEKMLKFYVAFKRLRNFACVELKPTDNRLLVYVKVDPDSVALREGFTRDVRGIGHYGTGNLEITIRGDDDLEEALPLIQRSYEVS